MNPKQIILRALSILTIIAAVGVVVLAILDFKPFMSRATKIQMIADSTGLSNEQAAAMAAGCIRPIQLSCVRAPVSEGTYRIVLENINTIGGKWGGSGLKYETSLSGVTASPGKLKNWKNSITQQPFKDAEVTVKITLNDQERAIHQDHAIWVSMSVVTPILGSGGTFKEKTKTLDRNLVLYTVTPDEMNILRYISIDPWDIVGVFVFFVMVLLLAAVFYAFSVDVPAPPPVRSRSNYRRR